MPRVGQLGVERPETADEPARVLRDRLGKIAARRADRADDADRAALAGERRDRAAALVKLRQPRRQRGGKTFLGGHFFEPRREFAQRLGPAAGRVGEHGDALAHVAVILGQRDAGVDGDLARGDRHVRGVGDEDRALHQRPAGARVLQFGKFAQHLGHFVAALAAADEHDDFGVGPFGELVLRDRFAGAESAGDRRRAAFADGEKCVNDALAGDERLDDAQPLANRARRAHRPLLQHRNFARAGRRFRRRPEHRAKCIRLCATMELILPLTSGGTMTRCRTNSVSATSPMAWPAVTRVADFHERLKRPAFCHVERLDFFAAPDPRAAVRLNARQRPLDAVVNVADQARPEPHGQRRAGATNRRAGFEHRRVFINLDRRAVADEPHDFADEAEFADVDDFIHLRAAHAAGGHGRAADARHDWIGRGGHAPPPVELVSRRAKRERQSAGAVPARAVPAAIAAGCPKSEVRRRPARSRRRRPSPGRRNGEVQRRTSDAPRNFSGQRRRQTRRDRRRKFSRQNSFPAFGWMASAASATIGFATVKIARQQPAADFFADGFEQRFNPRGTQPAGFDGNGRKNQFLRRAASPAPVPVVRGGFFRLPLLRRRGCDSASRFRAAEDFVALAFCVGENFRAQNIGRILVGVVHSVSLSGSMRMPTASCASWRRLLRSGNEPIRSGNLDDQRPFAFKADSFHLRADAVGDFFGEDDDAAIRLLGRDACDRCGGLRRAVATACPGRRPAGIRAPCPHRRCNRISCESDIFCSSIMAKAKPSTASPSPSATNRMVRGSSSGFSAIAPMAAEPIRPTA